MRRMVRRSLLYFELVTENSEGAVLDTLVSGLKLIPGDAGDLRGALVKRLNDTPVLLILDNCETAHSSVAKLVRYLRSKCPNLRILATSQHQLGLPGFEAVYELPLLSVPDDRPGSLDNLENLESYKLFVVRAQMADASWMPEANSESSLRGVLQLTEGIPLAIEIIAAWAPVMSLAQICEELTQTPLGSVTEVDEFNSVAPERHRSMLRCLEWSLRHLSNCSPSDAAGFKRLGVFAGRFTEDAVGKVCEVAAPRELLAHLVKMSLVRPCPRTDPRRYSMLRFTRAFAQQKARTDGIDQTLMERHVDFFFGLASPLNEKGEWEPISLASPEDDWPDLLAAADAASRIGNLRAVWQISHALSSFLQQSGLWSERERLNRAAVKAASDANYWVALERSLLELGSILEAQGLWAKAAEQYRHSLYFANRNAKPNPSNQAMALQRLGTVLTRMGDTAGADRARVKLDEVSRLLQEPKAKARALEAAGNMLQSRGDLVSAEAKHREAFQIRESIGDAEGMAWSQSNLGKVLTLLRDWEPAERQLRQTLDYWTSRADAQQQGILLHQLADLFRRRGQLSQACDYCNRSLTFLNGFPKTRATALALLATILCALGDNVGAVVALSENQRISKDLGDTEGQGIALDRIGEIHTQLKHWELALNALEASRRIKELPEQRDLPGLGITHDLIARLYTQQGRWSEALVYYESSLRCLTDQSLV